MIRLTALWLFILAVGALSIHNWYRGVLGLVALIAVVEHPDFPKTLAGIQGLNPWNILLVVTIISWLVGRSREGLRWDMPQGISFLIATYVLLMIVAFLRAATDLGGVIEFAQLVGAEDLPTFTYLFSDHIINCLKWIVPAFMLYDGCRDEKRLKEAVIVVLGVYLLLAVQIIRWMPLSVLAEGQDLGERALKILSNEIGFHRVNLSMMMSASAWAAMYAASMFESRSIRIAFYISAVAITFAMALTGGRTGYATWAIMGFGYAALRSRKMLVILPVAALLAVPLIPGLSDRLMSGFAGQNVDTNVAIEVVEQPVNQDRETGVDLYTVTSGRTFAWPFVLEKIEERLLLGYGRMAMQRTGVAQYLYAHYGESFPHPHNLYLEWAFDNGLAGVLPVFLFYGLVLTFAFRLIRGNRVESSLGGITIALVGGFLIAGMGSQTFYPREGAVCMWIVMLLTIRFYQLHDSRNLDQSREDKIPRMILSRQ